MPKKTTSYPYQLVPFTSDYGFKVTFGHDGLFTRKAIQLLIKSDVPISKLVVQRSEFSGFTMSERTGIYDVIFKDEQKRIFIIEMQVDNYEYLIERLLYYTFHMYCSNVHKGEEGFANLQPIYCICIIEGNISNFKGYYQKITLQNETGLLFSSLIEFDFIELGKFPFKKHEFNKITTEIDQLLYTMKYAHKIKAKKTEETPSFWQKDWLNEALQKLDLSQMDPEERAILDMELLRQKITAYNRKKEIAAIELKAQTEAQKTIETETLKVQNEAQKTIETETLKAQTEAQKTIETEKERAIIAAHQNGLAIDLIAQILQTTAKHVTEVIEAYNK